jgi:hypothetical protein
VLLLPLVGEIIELSDLITGFRGERPKRPYLCYRQFPPIHIMVVPLSRQEESPRSDYRIPATAAFGLTDDSFIVDWPKRLEYGDFDGMPSLGHLEPDLCQQVLEHLRRLFGE